jgi:hypothetical protein
MFRVPLQQEFSPAAQKVHLSVLDLIEAVRAEKNFDITGLQDDD